ncbi:cysteine-rich receptor-like protein kinase 25 isoform X2 [Nymphaea colorata]|uniref:cysteine-rich receptor-like protein kinase 25 isoform X2 n=1 Tax=Nymphaea colorata TaxID=210225 RepID=UPI00214E5A14|nr:cysteine-rich receptor-like protein kinase 25 isoform X2 [Nymphaea colorata]
MLDKAVRLKLLIIVAAQLLHVCDSYFEFSTCYNSTNYTINSNFAMNLNRLFSTLTANAPATGFYTDAVGQGVDRVYGLILCRGDLSAGDCGNCATTAPMELMKLCPRRRRGTIWYDECFLRYKDSNFIGNVTMDSGFCMWKLANNSDPVLFDHQAGQLMRSLSASVLSNRTGLMFASGEISFGDYNTIYGVAQCTRDISRDDCSQCLAGRISRIPERCEGKVGCIVYNGNCGVRYEIYPFVYNATASQQPSSPSPAISPPVPTMATQEAKPSPTLFNTTRRSASHGLRKNAIVLIALLCSSVFILCIISVLSVARRSKRGKAPDEEEMKGTTPSVFHMDTLKAATNNFSGVNKLGQGGFGPVYKGTLEDGTQVAVKRLSEKSTQGPAQFKNEVNLVAKLHHRNLARLLGYYLDEQERLLVYEFVPSGSLDKILFDPTKRQQLDWGKRLQIINGIGRGLLYLHEDSQLMIIHRDLKAGNVLLDEEMNPKISDFGLAKLFQVEGTHATTENVAGTRGYMSPEYAMNGIFSVKSDVFSFGVLVLEILSGQRNTSFYQSELAPDLLTYFVLELIVARLGSFGKTAGH